ncbi:MAG: hypothetical protein HUU50_19030 [Candidatus Brocadiae bacterium]|nr:hypothetical protein [Candidatus Brocadiia bacterium]
MAKYLLLFVFVFAFSVYAVPVQMYFNNFDGTQSYYSGYTTVTGGFSGTVSIESVGGLSGIGVTGNTFSGSYLRNSTSGNPASTTVLTLSNLPVHDTVSINFLLALINSWDGDASPYGPDILNVKVNGSLVFSYNPRTYANSTALSMGSNTFNMYLENALKDIPHTASTLTVEWYASGSGWQGGADESWAIENVQIVANIPEPGTCVLFMFAFLAFFMKKYSK